jgi:hypothetical protein
VHIAPDAAGAATAASRFGKGQSGEFGPLGAFFIDNAGWFLAGNFENEEESGASALNNARGDGWRRVNRFCQLCLIKFPESPE